jgi:cytochrome d ubiquinol oxidase subunit II
MNLEIIWFLLVAVLFTGYVVLDGFDLGVGVMHLFSSNEKQRNLNINSIGPVWDGNEVWLITGGGALFAAFPVVYATVFSSFYMALVLLLLCLILRAVSLEFRHHFQGGIRRIWDHAFAISSTVAAILYGVAFANILKGIPLTENAYFQGNFWSLISVETVAFGVFALLLLSLHGALYLIPKVSDDYASILKSRVSKLWIANLVVGAVAVALLLKSAPHLWQQGSGTPFIWVFVLAAVAAFFTIPKTVKGKKPDGAFFASCAVICATMGFFALCLFPNIVYSSLGNQFHLTIYNSSSTPITLKVMLVIAAIGMPLVLAYSFIIYRVFSGKTPEDGYY